MATELASVGAGMYVLRLAQELTEHALSAIDTAHPQFEKFQTARREIARKLGNRKQSYSDYKAGLLIWYPDAAELLAPLFHAVEQLMPKEESEQA